MNSFAYPVKKGENKENLQNYNFYSDNKENIPPKYKMAKKNVRTPLRDITNFFDSFNESPNLKGSIKESPKEFYSPNSKPGDISYIYSSTKKSSVKSELKFIR